MRFLRRWGLSSLHGLGELLTQAMVSCNKAAGQAYGMIHDQFLHVTND